MRTVITKVAVPVPNGKTLALENAESGQLQASVASRMPSELLDL